MFKVVKMPGYASFHAYLLSYALILLCISFQVTHAVPARRADLEDASPEFWRTVIKKELFAGKQCVFYYKAGVEAKAYVARSENAGNKITIWNTYDNNQYMNYKGGRLLPWINAGREIEYFQHQSQVFAENCQGEVLAMFLDSATPNEPAISIWTDTEFPTIKGNLLGANPSGVTKVTRVDANGANPTTIWTKPASLDIKNKKMRIMALGDSITVGYPGNPSNGYRKQLLNDLNVNGNTITYIGSHQDGDFPNPRHEGVSGATIDQISSNADNTLPQRPNVVLLHAGTNNMDSDANAAAAPDKLASLVDKIVSKCPDAAVMVARIIHAGPNDPDRNRRTFDFNNAIYGIVQSRANNGKHVYLVDQYTSIVASDLTDGLHPSPAGYAKMGDVWNLAFRQVNSMDWINDPVPGTGGPSTKQICNGKLFWNPFGQLANGAGLGKDFYPGRVCTDYYKDTTQCTCNPTDGSIGNVEFKPASGKCSDLNQDNTHAVRFADLNGDGRDEYIWVGANGEVTAFVNGGQASDGHWIWYPQPSTIASGVGGKRSEIQFADLNGDGRAEYLWVHPDGSVDVWLNQQKSTETASTLAINWFQQTMSATGIGRDGAGVRFADLNGDGRAEYLYVDDKGAVSVYLNGGGKDNGPNAGNIVWIPQTQSATGVGGHRNNTQFADTNGEGRADYLEVSLNGGSVSEWLNGGGKDTGPNAAVITWLPQGQIASGVGTSGIGVTFGDINGDGRAEYLDVDPNTSAVNMWFNGCA